ncbi:MAG TPA: hypothetical protein P5055_10605 [Candidatus Paceibacterota bacterium]|nr:hypothetical protein [Candidatus Paceibacterota bacterium]
MRKRGRMGQAVAKESTRGCWVFRLEPKTVLNPPRIPFHHIFPEQPKHTAEWPELFPMCVLDERYPLGLPRHYRLFREKLTRRERSPDAPPSG